MTTKLAPGERHRQAERKAKTQQAKWARLRRLEEQWEQREALRLRGQQAALKAEFLARHPELCGHDRMSGRSRLGDGTLVTSMGCDDCDAEVRVLGEQPYRPDPKLAA